VVQNPVRFPIIGAPDYGLAFSKGTREKFIDRSFLCTKKEPLSRQCTPQPWKLSQSSLARLVYWRTFWWTLCNWRPVIVSSLQAVRQAFALQAFRNLASSTVSQDVLRSHIPLCDRYSFAKSSCVQGITAEALEKLALDPTAPPNWNSGLRYTCMEKTKVIDGHVLPAPKDSDGRPLYPPNTGWERPRSARISW
jgi:hypothetical protein